jgi:hypothetical protein
MTKLVATQQVCQVLAVRAPRWLDLDLQSRDFFDTYSVQKNAALLTSSTFEGKGSESGAALAAQRRCSECGHSLHRHVALPNPEVARWLRLIKTR